MVKKKIIGLVLFATLFLIFSIVLFIYRKQTFLLGIPGDVHEATITASLGKIKVKLEDNQKKAFAQVYPEVDFSFLIQLSGVVREVNVEKQLVKIAAGENEGWVKISPNWHGNILTKNQQGEYHELTVINLSQGDWLKMISFLNKSVRILFLCRDKTCQETMGGHIYL